ncbi:beta-lactamase family protein [Chloroflexi bacterium TSY]|nr:beta-lactamase family protein [Chloroflexi bacterium TSY]
MSDLTNQVDELFSQWDKTHSPGCAIAIIQDGKMVYKRGYGMANLELNIPITTASVFNLASVSKQFTAMTIALLFEAGKIALHDDIRQYLPELPDHDTPILVEHLIHHTSGLRDYLALQLAGKTWDDVWTEMEALEFLARQESLNFQPGDEFAYSNSGYILLASIVQRITGQSLREFADRYIFQPLGMVHTTFRDHHKQIIPNRVSSYSRHSDGHFQNEYNHFQLVGDSGLYSSVEDLFHWDQNFDSNKLGQKSQSLIDLMYTTASLNDGSTLTYAFGLLAETYRGLKMVQHNGASSGTRTQIMRFPEQRFTVICLSNLDDFNPDEMCFKVSDLYLADVFSPIETGEAEEAHHPPESETSDADTGYQTLTDLAAYCGKYYSPELETTYMLDIENDQLTLMHKTGNDNRLESTVRDNFYNEHKVMELFFVRIDYHFFRDQNDVVQGFTISHERFRNVRFTRV